MWGGMLPQCYGVFQTEDDSEGAAVQRRPQINAARGRVYWLRPRMDAG